MQFDLDFAAKAVPLLTLGTVLLYLGAMRERFNNIERDLKLVRKQVNSMSRFLMIKYEVLPKEWEDFGEEDR